ncbi:hypothetical protein DWF00_03390 [Bosea caraganae]|uniref:Uncharacterized protein n=1 Tax=Bosea caraganae TaxID=2763117 RepID=A0A370L4X6_9HYPH|nr:hypothetical protein [Bosea caraganae]RDJ24142.1 hypothetical protein DWE98_14620 [Bosea caraganae]RDJ30184.1 hypothetical protein DWF00_03390 [Bosea caraganae]
MLFSGLTTAGVLALAGFFLRLFYERYWSWRACIAEAESSCLTPDGNNLTGGGMVWSIPAAIFGLIALLRILRSIRRFTTRR